LADVAALRRWRRRGERGRHSGAGDRRDGAGEGRERERPRPWPPRPHGVTTIVPPMSGPWIQQKYLYVPGAVNFTLEACGNPTGAPDVSGVAKKPLPWVASPSYVYGVGSV